MILKPKTEMNVHDDKILKEPSINTKRQPHGLYFLHRLWMVALVFSTR